MAIEKCIQPRIFHYNNHQAEQAKGINPVACSFCFA